MTHFTADDIAAIRQQDGDLSELWAVIRAETAAENTSRRAAVLDHPDLADRLTQPPLRFSQPDHWTGYIPPAVWQNRPNPSAERAALLYLVAEAEKRAARRAA